MIESGFEIVCDRREIQKLVDEKERLKAEMSQKDKEIQQLMLQNSNIKKIKTYDLDLERLKEELDEVFYFDEEGQAIVQLKDLFKVIDNLKGELL